MEHLLAYIPSWVCYIAVFFLGYGICRLLNCDNIEEGLKVKQAEDDRVAAYIKELKADHARFDAEHAAAMANLKEQSCGTNS